MTVVVTERTIFANQDVYSNVYIPHKRKPGASSGASGLLVRAGLLLSITVIVAVLHDLRIL